MGVGEWITNIVDSLGQLTVTAGSDPVPLSLVPTFQNQTKIIAERIVGLAGWIMNDSRIVIHCLCKGKWKRPLQILSLIMSELLVFRITLAHLNNVIVSVVEDQANVTAITARE